MVRPCWYYGFVINASITRCLTIREGCERIEIPTFVGLWRSLGARFHGMEEVVGSIPTRSTIFSITYRDRIFQFGRIWAQIYNSLARLCPFRLLSQFLVDSLYGSANTLGNFLHVNIGGRGSA